METTPDPTPDPDPDLTSDLSDLSDLVDLLQGEEYAVTEPQPGVLHVTGRFSNPERIALKAAADSGDTAVALWAVSHHDDWALVCWDRPELVTITQKGATPQRWRHRKLPVTLRPDAQTFLEGASSPFDIVTRPKHQPTEAAREVLGRFGITDPPPPGWTPPVVEAPVAQERTLPAASARAVRKAAAPRAPKAPAKPVKPEPVVAVCPHCFMAIPATGVCDNCG